MNWLHAILTWFTSLDLLIVQANEYGTVTFEQMHLPEGLGWHCSIRASKPPRYSWSGSGMSLRQALVCAMQQARENPIKPIAGAPFAPKLGGAEFDDDE
jgi:hypothetical protein